MNQSSFIDRSDLSLVKNDAFNSFQVRILLYDFNNNYFFDASDLSIEDYICEGCVFVKPTLHELIIILLVKINCIA